MNRFDFKCLPLHLIGLVAFGGAAACGGAVNEDGRVQEDRPVERRAASLHVTTTLDMSNLFAPSVADRIQVDEILINLSEVRMLGADPRIPADGVPLLIEERIVRSAGADLPAIELEVPKYLLGDPELAVFLRVSPSEALDGASVVVHGRYEVISTETIRTTRSFVEATDPDVDPMHEDGSVGNDGRDCATDPDVDPMDCDEAISTTKSGLDTPAVKRNVAYVPFELRDEQVVDLLTALSQTSELEVVLGIPAARWLTAEAINTLDEASQAPAQAIERDDHQDLQSEPLPFALLPAEPPVDADDIARSAPSVSPKGYVLDDRSGLPDDGLRGF